MFEEYIRRITRPLQLIAVLAMQSSLANYSGDVMLWAFWLATFAFAGGIVMAIYIETGVL